MTPDPVLEQLLGEYYAVEGRESVEAFIARHPEHAAALREHFALNDIVAHAFETGAELPDRVGPFRVLTELGTGGMGTVYRVVVAEPTRGFEEGAVLALKVLHPHLFRRRGFFKRFLREAELGRRIHHPNVVRTLDIDAIELDGRTQRFLVMEYVDGKTLRDLLRDGERTSEELTRHIGTEVAKALGAIHEAGAVHRDLKPENVLITREHAVKVMDLGVARLADESLRLSQTGAFVGSIHYASPEQFGGRGDVDGRADLYALGLLLYELATGTNPFAGEDVGATMRRIVTEKPRKAGEINPQLSPFFEELLARLLAKEPGDRFGSAGEVLRVLGAAERSTWWRERSVEMRTTSRQPLRRMHISRETEVYGREAELALLHAEYEKASSGDGRVVLLDGEAGIGKTRLVDEFVSRLRQAGEDVNFLFAAYPPGGAAAAASAFTAAYLEQLGPEDLESTLMDYLPQTPLLVPAFAAVLRGDVTPNAAEPLTTDSLHTCFVHLTRTLAAERPTIVLIDDLHFAPEEGRALFSSIAQAVVGHPVMLIGAMRPDLPAPWTAGLTRLDQTRTVSLHRLGTVDLVRLLDDLFKSERLAERLADRIAAKSDGNPYFVFEIIQGLREDDLLIRREDGSWDTSEALEEIQVPSTILDLVNARIAKLTEDERNLLDVAACVGFEFDPSFPGEVLGMAAIPALRELGRIERAHRLIRSRGRHYVFDHHQVQEAIYGSLNVRLREAYHVAIADALVARSGGDADPEVLGADECRMVCEHFARGRKVERALPYLDRALAFMKRKYMNERAIALLRDVLDVPGLVEGTRRYELLLRLNACLDLTSDRDAQWRVLRELRDVAKRTGDKGLQAGSKNETGVLLKQLGRFDEALDHFDRGRALAREARSVRREAAAMGNRAIALRYLGRLQEALDLHTAALGMFEELGDEQEQAAAHGSLGVLHLIQGRYAEAREALDRQLAHAVSTSHRGGEGIALGNLAVILEAEGRFDEAMAYYTRSLEIARLTGDRAGEAATLGNLGNVHRLLGNLEEAADHYERQRELAREIRCVADEVHAEGNLGIVCKNRGLLGEARAHYLRQLELARELEMKESEAIALVNLGPVHGYLGDVQAAREALEASLRLSREIGAKQPEGFGLVNLSIVAEAEGDLDEALRLAEASLELREEIGYPHGIHDSLTRIGELRFRRGEHNEAARALREALERARALKDGPPTDLTSAILACVEPPTAGQALPAADTGDPLGTVHTRYFEWLATDDGEFLHDAKRALDHLVEHAPEDCRESMLRNVRLHREILEAWEEHIVGDQEWS